MLDNKTLLKLLRVFEEIYAERGAYRAIAQSVPNWKETFDFLMANEEYRRHVAETIADVSKKLESGQQILEYLKRLDKGPIH